MGLAGCFLRLLVRFLSWRPLRPLRVIRSRVRVGSTGGDTPPLQLRPGATAVHLFADEDGEGCEDDEGEEDRFDRPMADWGLLERDSDFGFHRRDQAVGQNRGDPDPDRLLSGRSRKDSREYAVPRLVEVELFQRNPCLDDLVVFAGLLEDFCKFQSFRRKFFRRKLFGSGIRRDGRLPRDRSLGGDPEEFQAVSAGIRVGIVP